ncbi:MAG: iron(III) transport system ATP-binding protein [Flavobacteriales bacterium]|jgi:iron(III) transport system ATP-binding protein
MLQLRKVAVHVSDRFHLESVDFSVNQGEAVAIIGESGCGKTSLLKVIYGLYDLDAGSIQWKDKFVSGPKENLVPGMPYMKYLSQGFDLMPFTSVVENIQKYLSRLTPETTAARTAELLEVVEMTAFAKAHVKTLSGGQKQRVALAQTLAKEPELLLLDEPFSHIDNFRKNKLRRSVFAYLKSKNITCLVATHDSTDVLAFTDKTIVMREGKIVTQGSTNTLYEKPPSYYVGSLFGDINEVPKSWFFKEVTDNEQILVYPRELLISEKGIAVTVEKSYFLGSHYLNLGIYKTQSILFNSEESLHAGSTVTVNITRP